MNYLRLFAAALAVLLIHCAAIGADSASSGILLYREPPATYVELMRYTALREKPVISDLVLPSGEVRQVRNAGMVARLEHPPANITLISRSKAEETLAIIQKLIAAYPQYRAHLSGVATNWQNAIATIKASDAKAATVPSTTAVPKSALPSLEVDGTSYMQPVLTGFDGVSVSISHDAGAARVSVEKLTPAQIAALNATSSKIKILRGKDLILEAQQRASQPDSFVALLTQDARTFPLTAFSDFIKKRNWKDAEMLARTKDGLITSRSRGVDSKFTNTPLIYLAAACAAEGEIEDALRICSTIEKNGDRAIAYRVVCEWALRQGLVPMAEAAAEMIDRLWDALPQAVRAQIERGEIDNLPRDVSMIAVQQSIARRLLVEAFAERGQNRDAINVGPIADADERLQSGCALLKGLMMMKDPFAEEFAETLLKNVKQAGRTDYKVKVLATQADALAEEKRCAEAMEKVNQAIAVIDGAESDMFASVMKLQKLDLLRRKTELYNYLGNGKLAHESLTEAFQIAEENREYDWVLRLSKWDPSQARATTQSIRKLLVQDAERKGKILKLISLARSQRDVGETKDARETLEFAAAILSKAMKPELEAFPLGKEQARNGDFAQAFQTAKLFNNTLQKQQLLHTIMVELAKRGSLREALETLQDLHPSEDTLDTVGAVFIGMYTETELFPMH